MGETAHTGQAVILRAASVTHGGPRPLARLPLTFNFIRVCTISDILNIGLRIRRRILTRLYTLPFTHWCNLLFTERQRIEVETFLRKKIILVTETELGFIFFSCFLGLGAACWYRLNQSCGAVANVFGGECASLLANQLMLPLIGSLINSLINQPKADSLLRPRFRIIPPTQITRSFILLWNLRSIQRSYAR